MSMSDIERARREAARLAAEAAAESWRASAAGQDISITALEELLFVMGSAPGADISSFEPAWARHGHTHFDGALYQYSDLIWVCGHGHGGKEEAMACAIAEARQRQEERQSVG